MIAISILLAVSHFGMLLICEYDDLTSNPRVYVEPLKGLIFFSWLIAISFGSLIPTTDNLQGEHHLYRTKAGLAVIVLLVLLFMYFFFVKIIMPKHYARETYLYWQKFMFDTEHPTHIHTYIFTCWHTKYFHVMFLSYVFVALPWIVQQMYEGFGYKKLSEHVDFAFLVIYALNFYTPAAIIFRMWRSRGEGSILPKEGSQKLDEEDAVPSTSGNYSNYAVVDRDIVDE